MKKRNWVLIIILAACLALFAAFWLYNRSRTDRVAPQVTVAQPEQIPEFSVTDSQQLLLAGITARDDRDGDVTASLIIERMTDITADGRVQVTYAAFDSSGNVGKAQRTIRYTDYEGPRFSLDRPLIYTYGVHFDVLDAVDANDWLDGDIRHKVKTTLLDETALTAEGIHNVQFRVTNSLGDTEELVLPVEVQYAGRYSAQLQLSEYLIYLPAGTAFRPESYLQEVIYRGRGIELNGRVSGTMELTVTGTVDPATPGVYPVSYTLEDTQNDAWTAYSKLIVVVEG